MSAVIPCQIFAAIDDLLVLDDILRSRTICDLVIELEIIFKLREQISRVGANSMGTLWRLER